MIYSKLTDQILELELKTKVSQETSIQTQILHLLAEVERRRLYSKEVPSLFEYCVSVLIFIPKLVNTAIPNTFCTLAVL